MEEDAAQHRPPALAEAEGDRRTVTAVEAFGGPDRVGDEDKHCGDGRKAVHKDRLRLSAYAPITVHRPQRLSLSLPAR
jgi:hypothetical protein